MRKYICKFKVFGVDNTIVELEIHANEEESAKFFAQQLGKVMFGNNFVYEVRFVK